MAMYAQKEVGSGKGLKIIQHNVTVSNICNFICNTYYVKSMCISYTKYILVHKLLKIVFHMNEGNSNEPQYHHLFVFVST